MSAPIVSFGRQVNTSRTNETCAVTNSLLDACVWAKMLMLKIKVRKDYTLEKENKRALIWKQSFPHSNTHTRTHTQTHTQTQNTKGLQLSRVMARRNVLADIGQLTPCLCPPLFSLNTIGGHCFTFYTILHYRSCSHNRWTFSAIVSHSGSAFQQFPRHMAAALYSPSMYHEYARKEHRTAC